LTSPDVVKKSGSTIRVGRGNIYGESATCSMNTIANNSKPYAVSQITTLMITSTSEIMIFDSRVLTYFLSMKQVHKRPVWNI